MSITKNGVLGIVSVSLIAGSVGIFWAGLPALGHERREALHYTLEVGFHQEPTFRGFPNAVAVFVTRSLDDRPMDRTKGDIVDLAVEVQLRDREATEARIVQSAKLEPLTQAFDMPNEYNAWFLPTVVGTYAFRVTGSVSDVSDPKVGREMIDMTFVCGKGSLDSDSAFDCVKAPQLFPSGQ